MKRGEAHKPVLALVRTTRGELADAAVALVSLTHGSRHVRRSKQLRALVAIGRQVINQAGVGPVARISRKCRRAAGEAMCCDEAN